MTAANPEQLPAMLEKAVVRFDATSNRRSPAAGARSTLDLGDLEIDPVIQRLIDLGRAEAERERAAAAAARATRENQQAEPGSSVTSAPIDNPPPPGSVGLYTVQIATPDADAFNAGVAQVRGASGVRTAGIRSTAIGGTSVLTVGFEGSIDQLAAALRSQGFTVRQANNALSVSR